MDLKAQSKNLRQEDEEGNYRAPDLGDPLYALELACIELAKKATHAAGGSLCPTFAPKPSLLAKITGRAKESHDVYSVPRIKSIYWLWKKYRPNPWVSADNQKVIEGWLSILYGNSTAVDVSKLVEETRVGQIAAYATAKERKVHFSVPERWQRVVNLISKAIPPYSESGPNNMGQRMDLASVAPPQNTAFDDQDRTRGIIDPSQESALNRIDMRGPSRAADCFDCVVAFPAAVEQMRVEDDDSSITRDMVAGTRAAFEALKGTDKEELLFVAAAAQDLLYRYVMQLTVLDRHTRAYCSDVIRHFFEGLTRHRIRTFYVLDNALREDRLQATLELFELSGITTVTPGRDGLVWANLASRLRAGMNACGHVAYIEPDSAVNHLDAARQLAGEAPCVATFRNLAPDNPEHEIINFKSADA